MKVLTAEQIREADRYTMDNEPVSSLDLMERAAWSCSEWLKERYAGKNKKFRMVCGIGNNGGDGLVIARHLNDAGFEVEVDVLRFSEKTSDDFQANFERLKGKGITIRDITGDEKGLRIGKHEVIVDAVFGSGLSRPVEGFVADVIEQINHSEAIVVSVDMPSGLFSEDNSKNEGTVIKAAFTLTFQVPKLALFYPQNAPYAGHWVLLDIGLDQEFIGETKSIYHYVCREDIIPLLKKRFKFSHKGTYGHALLCGGSYGKVGAIVLAAKSCIRSGTGMLTVHLPRCGYGVMQSVLPEAMVIADEQEYYITDDIGKGQYDAIGVGPGLGKEEETRTFVKILIQNTPVPLVMDADALNILAENKTWLSFLPASSVLTPHPGEFRRLAGEWSNDEERLQLQKDFAVKYKVYLVLKDAYTAVACPDGEVFFNSTGNPGMAAGGSGDVLTGIITGLMARGYDSKQAAVFGVFLHGMAGDIAAEKLSMEAMTAADIINELPAAFLELKKN